MIDPADATPPERPEAAPSPHEPATNAARLQAAGAQAVGKAREFLASENVAKARERVEHASRSAYTKGREMLASETAQKARAAAVSLSSEAMKRRSLVFGRIPFRHPFAVFVTLGSMYLMLWYKAAHAPRPEQMGLLNQLAWGLVQSVSGIPLGVFGHFGLYTLLSFAVLYYVCFKKAHVAEAYLLSKPKGGFAVDGIKLFAVGLIGGFLYMGLPLSLPIVGAIIYAAVNDASSARGDSHGTAQWADEKTLAKKGLLGGEGFQLGRFAGQLLAWPHEGHLLTVAPTGAGKGVGIVIPNLLVYPGSVIVLDPKGENFKVTARARRSMGHRVFCLDPFETCGETSACLNPLDGLEPSKIDVADSALTLADMLILRSETGADVQDGLKARAILRGLILHVVCDAAPDARHLGEVRRLLLLDAVGQTALWAAMAASTSAHGGVARSAQDIASLSEQERAAAISAALRHTEFLDSTAIQHCLSKSDFSLKDLKATPNLTLFLVLPPDRLATYTRLIRLWMNSCITAMQVPGKPARRVLFLLDEMAQLGPMEPLVRAVSLMRGYGMTLWVILQDLAQLKGLYPDRWETFLSNAAVQQFFGVSDHTTAEHVSRLLGEVTITVTAHTQSQAGGWSMSRQGKSTGTVTSETARALLKPDEVRRLASGHQLLFVPGCPPIRAERLDYREDEAYAGRFDENPMYRPLE